jgi:hypothetical protein
MWEIVYNISRMILKIKYFKKYIKYIIIKFINICIINFIKKFIISKKAKENFKLRF